MFIFLILVLVAVASANPGVPLSDIDDVRSAVAVSQLVLAQQAQFFKELINATRGGGCNTGIAHLRAGTGRECPFPYTDVMGECYYLSKTGLKWTDARTHCKGMEGDLATPKLLYALKTYMIESQAPKSMWVGGEDKEDGSGWQWVSGEPIDDKDWVNGKPVNTRFRVQQCLELRRDRHPPLKNVPCYTVMRFICQYK